MKTNKYPVLFFFRKPEFFSFLMASSWLVFVESLLCSKNVVDRKKIAENIAKPIIAKLSNQLDKSQKVKTVYLCSDFKDGSVQNQFSWFLNFTSAFYSSKSPNHVDFRVILPPKMQTTRLLPFSNAKIEQVLLFRNPIFREKFNLESTLAKYGRLCQVDSNVANSVQVFDLIEEECGKESAVDSGQLIFKQHEEVCLGGTFDRLHNGHKQLVSVAATACSKRLTVGVTTGPMIESRKLFHIPSFSNVILYRKSPL